MHPNNEISDARIPPLGEIQAGQGIRRGCGGVDEHEGPWSLQAA